MAFLCKCVEGNLRLVLLEGHRKFLLLLFLTPASNKAKRKRKTQKTCSSQRANLSCRYHQVLLWIVTSEAVDMKAKKWSNRCGKVWTTRWPLAPHVLSLQISSSHWLKIPRAVTELQVKSSPKNLLKVKEQACLEVPTASSDVKTCCRPSAGSS